MKGIKKKMSTGLLVFWLGDHPQLHDTDELRRNETMKQKPFCVWPRLTDSQVFSWINLLDFIFFAHFFLLGQYNHEKLYGCNFIKYMPSFNAFKAHCFATEVLKIKALMPAFLNCIFREQGTNIRIELWNYYSHQGSSWCPSPPRLSPNWQVQSTIIIIARPLFIIFFLNSAFSRRHNVENAEKHSHLSFPHAGRHEALRADTSNFLIPVFIMHTVVWSTSP